MKKILALVLALTLAMSVASVALAEHVMHPDSELDPIYTIPNTTEYGHLQPGESYLIMANATPPGNLPTAFLGAGSNDEMMDFIRNNPLFETTSILHEDNDISVEWLVGGAMVESTKYHDLDDNDDTTGGLVITLNENFTIDTLKDLKGIFTFEGIDPVSGIEYELEQLLLAQVANNLVIVDGYSKVADAADNAIEAYDNTIYKCSEDAPGYVVFNANSRLFSTTLKMVKNEKAFMFSNEDMIEAVEEMYGNLEADIECYQFGGSPTFTNEAAFSLQADYADQYFVYEWNGKTLTKVDYEWDSINGLYKWATKSPTDYVISDKELVMAEEEVEDKNPNTGANDVVGVAAALAVVSLIATAAVSRKK